MNGNLLREQLKSAGPTPRRRSVDPSPGPTPTLLIHTLKGTKWFLPWSRFVSACHEGDELVLVFGEQEVVIRGDRLAQLEPALAHCGLQVLRELPAEYRALSATEPFITQLTVRPWHAGPS